MIIAFVSFDIQRFNFKWAFVDKSLNYDDFKRLERGNLISEEKISYAKK